MFREGSVRECGVGDSEEARGAAPPPQDLRLHRKAPAFIAKPIATTLAGATVLCQTLNFYFVVQVYCAKVFVPIL
jgi:hypothetical protein